MTKKVAMTFAFIYAGISTFFALLSGSRSIEGGKGLLANLPNVLPWLLVWGALLATWKNPAAGAVLFLGLAAAATMFFHTYQELLSFLMISVPLIIIAGLFFLDSQRERGISNR